jgi:hypothetical protein
MSEQAISRVLFSVSVTLYGTTIIHLRALVAQYLLRPTRKLGRAALKRLPIWSCFGWGLPNFPGHPENWCALTTPFHPYPMTWGYPCITGRYLFCGTFLRVTATPCYGAPCPLELGLSSRIYEHIEDTSDRLAYSDISASSTGDRSFQ